MLSENAKKSYEAFWNHEANGRACLHLTYPKDDGTLMPLPEDVTAQWEDLDALLRIALHNTENTVYLADAFPCHFINFGPGCLAAMIGGTYKLSPHTVWFENEPFVIQDFDCLPEFRLHRESPMYSLVDRFTKRFLEAGKGKLISSITDIGGTYDILAALRGTQSLLTDLYDCPEQVKEAVRRIQPVWKDYYLHYARLLMEAQGCMISWMPIYSEKTYYPLQCDFSAMISPDMFEEFILPDLKLQTEYMDRSIYHWDGPDEIPHLKHLLSLPRLSAIQWTSGDGAPDVTDECWFDNYQRIQAAGKSLVLLGGDAAGYENLLKHISTKGLFVLHSAGSAREAREIERIFNAAGVK